MFTCIVLLLLMSTKPHPVGSYELIHLSAFSSRVHTFFLLLQSSPHLHLSASSISHLFPHHFYFSPHLHLSVSYSIHFYTFLPALNAPHFLFIFIHTRDLSLPFILYNVFVTTVHSTVWHELKFLLDSSSQH